MSDASPQIVTDERTEYVPEETPQLETGSPSFRLGAVAVAILAFAGLFGYSLHERNVAQQLVHDNDQTAAALKETRGQMDALNAKLDALASARQPVARQVTSSAVGPITRTRATVVRHGKADPRWKKLQNQLDTQGKAIDETRNGLESTRNDLLSTRTELQGSIATTHDELVVLQRKGERNYYEFDLDKSKQFSHSGPVGVSLRKANTKHRYADLELMVDDNHISKKHLNVYEPAMFYPGDAQQPLELVINSISKNHIHGYISAPRYRASELAAMSGNSAAPLATTAQNLAPVSSPQLRRR